MPSDEIFSGIAILFAGALMLTPGFLTDVVGLVILIPPIRSVAIAGIRRNFHSRATKSSATWNLETWATEEPYNEDGPPFGEQDN